MRDPHRRLTNEGRSIRSYDYIRGHHLIVLNLDRALTQDKMPAHWTSSTFLVGIALCAIGIHAAPQPLMEFLALGKRLGRVHGDLKEEDHKFVTDPSANSDGNLNSNCTTNVLSYASESH